MDNMHMHNIAVARLKRITGHAEEIMAILNDKMCCDMAIADNINNINSLIVNLYDYVTNLPEEEEEEETEEDLEEGMELSIKTDSES